MNPRYSIVIPCRDRPVALERAIRSCITQTEPSLEVLVVDDGSVTPLRSVCDGFGDARVRYLREEVSGGPSRARNRGIAEAKGAFISFLDSDDYYLPERLAVIDKLVCAEPDAVIIHSQRRILRTSGAFVRLPVALPRMGQRLDEYVLVEGNFVQINGVVVPRLLASRIGFDPRCTLYEDTKFLLECWLASGAVVCTREVLAVYVDIVTPDRLSRRRGLDRFQPFLQFAAEKCSKHAYWGLLAFSAAEMSFFRTPWQVLRRLRLGRRAGVTWTRCCLYLSRSVVGSQRINQIMAAVRGTRS